MGIRDVVVKQNVNSPKIGDGYRKKKNLNRTARKGQSGRIMGCLG